MNCGAFDERSRGPRQIALLTIAGAAALLSACSSPAPGPAPQTITVDDELEMAVDRLRSVLGNSGEVAKISNAQFVPRMHLVHDFRVNDGEPATATITIRTIPEHEIVLPAPVSPDASSPSSSTSEVAASRQEADQNAATSADTDGSAAAASPTDAVYRLSYGKKGWKLDEQPATELERLWFEYALQD